MKTFNQTNEKTIKMYAQKDYYDKNGRLLLAKGAEITEAIMQKLTYYFKDGVLSEPENPKIDTKEISKKLHICDTRILDDSAEILSKIIFESKTEPWWYIVNSLGFYVEWLYTHSINVALISLIMAKRLGFDTRKLWNIGLGALLHDVGKLLIPKKILWKKTALSSQEIMYVRQHCELGASMTEGYDLCKDCKDIILQHHERIDGSGYPLGLKNNQIHMYAKIVMVADVIDAMTTYRPYRSAKEIDKALNELRNEGKKFSQVYVYLLGRILNVFQEGKTG